MQVSYKNRLERFAFANACLKYNEKFHQTFFIDESTIQLNRNGSRIWFKLMPHENAFGLVGKFKSPSQVNVIGGISRLGATNLLIFDGKMDAEGFERMSRQFMLPFLSEKCQSFISFIWIMLRPTQLAGYQFFSVIIVSIIENLQLSHLI